MSRFYKIVLFVAVALFVLGTAAVFAQANKADAKPAEQLKVKISPAVIVSNPDRDLLRKITIRGQYDFSGLKSADEIKVSDGNAELAVTELGSRGDGYFSFTVKVPQNDEGEYKLAIHGQEATVPVRVISARTNDINFAIRHAKTDRAASEVKKVADVQQAQAAVIASMGAKIAELEEKLKKPVPAVITTEQVQAIFTSTAADEYRKTVRAEAESAGKFAGEQAAAGKLSSLTADLARLQETVGRLNKNQAMIADTAVKSGLFGRRQFNSLAYDESVRIGQLLNAPVEEKVEAKVKPADKPVKAKKEKPAKVAKNKK